MGLGIRLLLPGHARDLGLFEQCRLRGKRGEHFLRPCQTHTEDMHLHGNASAAANW